MRDLSMLALVALSHTQDSPCFPRLRDCNDCMLHAALIACWPLFTGLFSHEKSNHPRNVTELDQASPCRHRLSYEYRSTASGNY